MSDDRTIPTPAPADRPSFTIRVDGTDIPPEYSIASIVVTRSVNRIAAAKIVVMDGDPAEEDFPISNADTFLPGKRVEISAGYHSNEEMIFSGTILRYGVRIRKKGPSMLTVECRDEAVKLTIGRKNAYFYSATDAEIIEEVAGNAGITTDVSPTTVQHDEMVQYHATDWDFIVARAEANGRLVHTEDGRLTVKAPDLGQDPALSLLYGGTMLDFEAEIDARLQYNGVTAWAWDPANQEMLELGAESFDGTLPGNISADDLAAVAAPESFDLKHSGSLNESELQEWANAQLLKSRLAKVKGRVRFQGYGAIRPGHLVELNGVGDRINGNAFISGIRHHIDVRNWETDLEFGLSPEWFVSETDDVTAPPASALLPTVGGLHVGLVTKLEADPDGEDRVQVRLPTIDPEAEGVWARVATLDAGENRGTFFRPEIGDEVVLGFLNDDPRKGVILGMMNSSARPAPLTASDDNPEKGIVTREGMRFIFDDANLNVTLETPNGNRLVLSQENGSVTVEDENGNTITMNSGGITLDSAADVKIKASGDVTIEGTNVTLSANAQLKAEGSAGAELSSSGSTTVKGSIVQIN